jgi:hypothetical protein
MPSPFPGMDPYLEDFEWEDFHLAFNTVVREFLAPSLQPRYIVRLQRRVYVEHGVEPDDQVRLPDVSVLWTGHNSSLDSGGVATHALAAPIECINPSPMERRESYLVVREVSSLEIVTVIDTLSPTNKRTSSDGREQYLTKREEILSSHTNLVEFDLLRGGARLPIRNLPPGDYFAVISRGYRHPKAEVYPWTLRQKLPAVLIPLRRGEPDVSLDLQKTFDTVYDRAFYGASLNYEAPLKTPLSASEHAWKQELIARKA